MDEARRVIDRLERIDALRSAGAAPRALLVELRELVREGQEWAGVEGREAGAARAALDSIEEALAARPGRETPGPREEVGPGGRRL
jgi:hypothetical protein